MATIPEINARDGSISGTTLEYTTNSEYTTITGTISADTVDLQVSINDGDFVSDPSLVYLNGTEFTVPNPSLNPAGLFLELGVNTIRVRAIGIIGDVSPAATITVTRVASTSDDSSLIPTGIRLNRLRNSVEILVSEPNTSSVSGFGEANSDLEFLGYNFYAATSEAGSTGSGYVRINSSPVLEIYETEETILPIDDRSTEFDLEAATKDLRIQLSEVDEFGAQTSERLDVNIDVSQQALPVRFAQTIVNVQRINYIKFRHVRSGSAGLEYGNINQETFQATPATDPLYYVVTGVWYDSEQNAEIESPYSQEVVGAPLIIDTNIRDLPGRNRIQVVRDFIAAVQRVDTEISLIPGSTTRDVSIDPFSSEAERLWFLLDFVHRSQSFLTLLQIDDANSDDISDAVVSSAYKQALKAALGLTTDTAVQNLIDTQFDKLARNFTTSRAPGRAAVGRVVFYTTARPTQDTPIPSGTIVSTTGDSGVAAVRFRVGGTYVLPVSEADAYFNFETQRYEVIADVTAETIGSSGNRPAGSITQAQGVNLNVTNTEATYYGSDRESNASLARRAQIAMAGVDAGTENGYVKTIVGTVDVLKTKVIKSGDSMMMRDWDDVRKKHAGGKVDIWIQGLRERTVSERFSFTFEVIEDSQCLILDATNLIFRIVDPRVTINTPVTEILDNLSAGHGVRNVSLGLNYDLTGVTILDYQTFQIDNSIPQPSTAIDDIITADFRFQSINQFTPTIQPVRRVVSVVGQVSGTLDPQQYILSKIEDPLLEGESTIAQDYIEVSQLNGIPTGDSIDVNAEEHVMIGFFEERLGNIGINTATIRVYSEDRVTEYNGPSTATPDFDVIEGSPTTPVKIVRASSSQISNGETVSVDYTHDENFTITYVVNDLLQQLQILVNIQRHVTADVLVKQAILNLVDIETTAQLKVGATKDKTDPQVRTNVSVEFNQRDIGSGIAQSDIVESIDSTPGVDFQVLPLARMGYADGSRKLRATLLSTSTRIPSLDVGGNLAYIMDNSLEYPTTDGGGLSTEHRGVFQDDEIMTMSSSLTTLGNVVNSSYIVGASGAVISGYSDDATLISAGFTDPDDILSERLRRTANRVFVALSASGPDVPTDHSYAVSYVIRNDVGPHDITASPVEFLDPGQVTLTFRSAST